MLSKTFLLLIFTQSAANVFHSFIVLNENEYFLIYNLLLSLTLLLVLNIFIPKMTSYYIIFILGKTGLPVMVRVFDISVTPNLKNYRGEQHYGTFKSLSR